jgi:hypothetical protein
LFGATWVIASGAQLLDVEGQVQREGDGST